MSVLPVDSLSTPRFVGLPSFMRLPLATSLAGLDAAIIGLPSDSGAPYRTGARFGPNALRAMSVMLRPINPSRGNINVFEVLKVADAGDANVVPGYEIESLALMERSVATLVDAGVIPCAIGGDHSVSLAALRAVAHRHGPVGLIHFDSHTDTWDSYFDGKRYSAGTMFRRAVEEGLIDPSRSIQIGLRGSLFQPTDVSQSEDLGYRVITCDEMFDLGLREVARLVAERAGRGPSYASFDLDFVDPAFAPGVQTPECGGPSAREALALVRMIRGVTLVGFDVVELNPLYDGPGQITALLGATILAEFLALIAETRLQATTSPQNKP
ncbi:agmatinase [Pseudorhodobacter sp.]|uniref:agmatinase n=1 Tax=Pseudorhodobacter sp. TaxID=1934400 RepID=UPI002649CDBB|nr:agmatinase [Pseudorhodobacter sp.]MDN5787937.1 agmatinase [Pseudorhodobacter sp.]